MAGKGSQLSVLAAFGASLLLAGCGLTGSGTARTDGHVREIEERDFKIEAPRTLPPGRVALAAENYGPAAHELIIARRTNARLPLRADGITVDEDRISPEIVHAIEPIDPGVSENFSVNLKPGRYVLFCNMAGHFKGGMRTQLVVR